MVYEFQYRLPQAHCDKQVWDPTLGLSNNFYLIFCSSSLISGNHLFEVPLHPILFSLTFKRGLHWLGYKKFYEEFVSFVLHTFRRRFINGRFSKEHINSEFFLYNKIYSKLHRVHFSRLNNLFIGGRNFLFFKEKNVKYWKEQMKFNTWSRVSDLSHFKWRIRSFWIHFHLKMH